MWLDYFAGAFLDRIKKTKIADIIFNGELEVKALSIRYFSKKENG